jgi:hypothetical protein
MSFFLLKGQKFAEYTPAQNLKSKAYRDGD